ncbi:MAG: hypothetical protein AAFN91_15055 [Pseudomonadota bacterium]
MLTRRDLFLGKRRDAKDLSSEDGAAVFEYAMIAGVLGVVTVATLAKWRRRSQKAD